MLISHDPFTSFQIYAQSRHKEFIITIPAAIAISQIPDPATFPALLFFVAVGLAVAVTIKSVKLAMLDEENASASAGRRRLDERNVSAGSRGRRLGEGS